jgi:hypothetical protein
MEVVNCSFGHQMGWLQVNESTLVVDIQACFPIQRLYFEITRLAAFLCGRPYKAYPKNLFGEPWPLTISNKGSRLKPQAWVPPKKRLTK